MVGSPGRQANKRGVECPGARRLCGEGLVRDAYQGAPIQAPRISLLEALELATKALDSNTLICGTNNDLPRTSSL